MKGNRRHAPRNTARAPSRSCTSAGWTTTLSRKPSVSTRICRLRPLIFFLASKPCESSAQPPFNWRCCHSYRLRLVGRRPQLQEEGEAVGRHREAQEKVQPLAAMTTTPAEPAVYGRARAIAGGADPHQACWALWRGRSRHGAARVYGGRLLLDLARRGRVLRGAVRGANPGAIVVTTRKEQADARVACERFEADSEGSKTCRTRAPSRFGTVRSCSSAFAEGRYLRQLHGRP
jgi:hypothetical protein